MITDHLDYKSVFCIHPHDTIRIHGRTLPPLGYMLDISTPNTHVQNSIRILRWNLLCPSFLVHLSSINLLVAFLVKNLKKNSTQNQLFYRLHSFSWDGYMYELNLRRTWAIIHFLCFETEGQHASARAQETVDHLASFMPSRETILRAGIKSPTSSLRLGYLSII